MGLAEVLDQAVVELRERPGETYEIACGVAARAGRLTSEPASAETATRLREIFGTLAGRIENYRGRDGLAEAEQAHHEIAEALTDWETGDQGDVSDFAARWIDRVGVVDTTWLEEPGELLHSRSGLLGFIRDRLIRRSRH